MVITLGGSPAGRGLRVWIGELPDATYPVSTVMAFAIPAAPSPHVGPRQAAIEYFRYTSPHTLNGLLGATFTPEQTDSLRVQIAVGSPGKPLGWTLNPWYALRTGLRSEMTIDHITSGVREAAHLSALGAGMLQFDHAAEGPPIIMKWLAEAIIAVLTAGDADTLTAQQLQDVLERVGPPMLWSPFRSVADSNNP